MKEKTLEDDLNELKVIIIQLKNQVRLAEPQSEPPYLKRIQLPILEDSINQLFKSIITL